MRLISRGFGITLYFNENKRDTAPAVYYSLVLSHYGHLKKLCLLEHVHYSCKNRNDEERAECCLCVGKAKRAECSGFPCTTSCLIELNPV